jgi:hypothetical protein
MADAHRVPFAMHRFRCTSDASVLLLAPRSVKRNATSFE